MSKVKALKFVCPECRGNRLGSVENVITTYPILNINSDGDLDYDYENAETGDSIILSYQCMDCGYELKDEQGRSILDCLKVPQWVKKHCKQR